MAGDEALYERNMTAFKERYPDVYHYMKNFKEPVMRPVGSVETGDLNIDLGHVMFYETDAVGFAERQLAKFKESPSRFYLDPPPSPPPSGHQSFVLSEYLHDYFRAEGITKFAPDATPDAGYLLIFGIGLGFHLPALFRDMDVRYFVLIEEFPEFLYHTLWFQDWTEIFERAEEKGQIIRMFFGTEARSVAAQIHWFMRGEGFGLLDGSFTYRHYRSLLLDGVHDQFVEDLPLLPLSDGFVEDEIVMINNCGKNFARYRFHLLDVRPRMEKDVPAFIVGSGPSFDKSVEVIRRYRDQVVVFSCGTGLSALLKHGIRPDFHCELENVYQSYDQLLRLRDTYGSLSDITLLASSTVYPDMPALFDRRVLFFRDSVSSSALWCDDKEGLYGMAPTCTNLGIRAALLMAFRQIYLFGVDLGTRDNRVHHAGASIYHTEEDWALDIENDPVRRMSIPMPGNFGGKALTNTILHWARMLMIQSLSPFPEARVYNCSDGVRITNTLPKLPQTVALDGSAARKKAALDRLFVELHLKQPGQMIDIATLVALRQHFRQWTEDFVAMIGQAKAAKMAFVPFYEAAVAFLASKGERPYQEVIHAVYVGTAMMIFQIGYFFYRRIDRERQTALMGVFLDGLSERLRDMERLVDDNFVGLIAFAEAEAGANAAVAQ